MKKIMTFKGEIAPESAGITLPHEHLLWDQWAYTEKSSDPDQNLEFSKPVIAENRGDIEMRPFFYKDNLVNNDITISISEARAFKEAGGQTIVDMTPKQFNRQVEKLAQFVEATGLNLVFGVSDYLSMFWNEDEKKRSARDIKNEIVDEFKNGISGLKAKPGIIGEVGISSLNDVCELNSLKGAALAQAEIGCGLNIHPTLFTDKGEYAKDGHHILDIIDQNGGNVAKTCISHCDLTFEDFEYHESLAGRGAYIEFDQFGMYAMTLSTLPGKYLPCDLHRVKAIKKLIDHGYLEKILISQDICFKHLMKKWGGQGYAHIINNIIPMMRDYAGISEEQINTIIIENPKNFLSF
jgi:phosphotriesterase-related protein